MATSDLHAATHPTWPEQARPAFLALASAIIPGLGQLLAGRRRRGLVLIGITAVTTAWVGFLVVARPLTIAVWGVQPSALRWLLVANGLALAFRVWAAADAYMAVADDPRLGLAGTGGALLVVASVVLIAPHAYAGAYDVIEYDLITSSFKTREVLAAPLTSPTTSTAVGPLTTLGPEEPARLVLQAPPSTTTTIPSRLWDGTGRLNVLLLGGDAGPGRRGVRTDTVILATLDPDTGNAALISVPRNMARVPLPDDLDIWKCDCFPDIINALWKYGSEHPDKFPGVGPAGAEALKAAISELTGLTVHHYAMVNLEGFVQLIDAVGGIEITVPDRVYDSDYPTEDGGREVIEIEPGEYTMDGHLALAYARSRQRSDDYNRMGRQRCVLQAVAAQADPVTVIRAFPDIANAIKNNISTDIPLESLPDLIALLPKINAEELVSLRLVPPTYTGARTPEGYNTPRLNKIQRDVQTIVDLPPAEAIELLGLDTNEETCT